MLQIVTDLLGSMITAWILFYAVFKFSGNKINYKDKKFWIALVGYAVYMIVAYKITDNFIRVVFSYVVLIITTQIIYIMGVLKNMISCFLACFILSISEMILAWLSLFILKIDMNSIKDSIFTNLTANLLIACIMFFLINIIKTKKIFKELFEQVYVKRNKIIIALFLMTILSFSIMLYSIYFNISTTYALFLNVILIIIYATLVINVFSQTNRNEKLQQDYELKISELSEYEKTLSEKRRLLHNRDNDLISIRGMIKNKKENVKAIEYINSILNEPSGDDGNILQKIEFIPEGGLQGLIHKKMSGMKSKDVKVYLQADENINELEFDKISAQKNKDLCTIVGIFLDNALEAAEMANQKNVSIILSRKKNDLIINISNTYKGTIDMSKIDEAGYSTKGDNRGYGLDIVKEIISKNKSMKNERQITGTIFNQKLIVRV